MLRRQLFTKTDTLELRYAAFAACSSFQNILYSLLSGLIADRLHYSSRAVLAYKISLAKKESSALPAAAAVLSWFFKPEIATPAFFFRQSTRVSVLLASVLFFKTYRYCCIFWSIYYFEFPPHLSANNLCLFFKLTNHVAWWKWII